GGGDPDVNYPGGYFYRTISLYDPFLKGNSRIIGKNWKGKEYLIKPDVYNYTENQSEYIVNMTYDDVLKIKKDNNNHNIDNFNNVYLGDDNMNSSNPHKDYKSRFIHDAALGFTNLFKKSGDR
ncbi:MAG: hypothetical protein RSD40_02365, partial [Bacilli bacterium]